MADPARQPWPVATLLTIDGELLIVVGADAHGPLVRRAMRIGGSVEGRGEAFSLTQEQARRAQVTPWH